MGQVESSTSTKIIPTSRLWTLQRNRVFFKDGKIRWIVETVAPIQYRGRRATYGNFMDVTERKQAEQELKESLKKLKVVMEDAIESMALTIEWIRVPFGAEG